jgi:hypothetical protein
MAAVEDLANLTGRWAGPNKLWLEPDKPERRSDATMAVAVAGQGRFVTFTYTWADSEKPQDGLLVVGFEKDRGVVTGHWLDSWHNSDKVMRLEGEATSDGGIRIRGSYPAPPGPDWGWTIAIEPGADRFRLIMHNVWPEGREDLAVEAVFTRVS